MFPGCCGSVLGSGRNDIFFLFLSVSNLQDVCRGSSPSSQHPGSTVFRQKGGEESNLMSGGNVEMFSSSQLPTGAQCRGKVEIGGLVSCGHTGAGVRVKILLSVFFI